MSTPVASSSSSSATYYAMKETASLSTPPQPRPFHSSVLSFARLFGRHLLMIIPYLLIHIPHGSIILMTLAFVAFHIGVIVSANKEIDWTSFADADAAFEEISIKAEYDEAGRFLVKAMYSAGIPFS
ncbi:unnamed protein product [Peniophora sp. CBMAI 1063]|nr:unnamed protein product [Peniophora sp. CBMAI 1063]